MKRQEVISVLDKNKENFKFRVSINGIKKTKRLFLAVYNGEKRVFEFNKNSSRLGTIVLDSEIEKFDSVVPIIKDDLSLVKDFLTKVVKCLEESGLWSNILKDYKKILLLSDDELKNILSLSSIARFRYCKENNISFYCDDIIVSAKKGIISIPYDKDNREYIRETFKNAIKNNLEYNYFWRKGYDNRIGCNKVNDIMQGFYSAEFKNCGNGHYYIAIDERHAIFIEDD